MRVILLRRDEINHIKKTPLNLYLMAIVQKKKEPIRMIYCTFPAVLRYRLVNFKKENGAEGRRIPPYLIDLELANGTFVNNVKLEPRRYHELLKRDVIKYGFSSRVYVLLHENSKYDTLDDDDV